MVHISVSVFAVVALGVSSALAAPVFRQPYPPPQKDDGSSHANDRLATTSTNPWGSLNSSFDTDPRFREYRGGRQPPRDQASKDRAAMALEMAGAARNAHYEQHADKHPPPLRPSESVLTANANDRLATTSANPQGLPKSSSFNTDPQNTDPLHSGSHKPPPDQAKDRAAIAQELADAAYKQYSDKRPRPHGLSESVPEAQRHPAQRHPLSSNGH